jgi:hypothetical protein
MKIMMTIRRMEDNKNNNMSNNDDGCGKCVDPPSITSITS